MKSRTSLNVWGGILGEHQTYPQLFDEHLNDNNYLGFPHQKLVELLENAPLAMEILYVIVSSRIS